VRAAEARVPVSNAADLARRVVLSPAGFARSLKRVEPLWAGGTGSLVSADAAHNLQTSDLETG